MTFSSYKVLEQNIYCIYKYDCRRFFRTDQTSVQNLTSQIIFLNHEFHIISKHRNLAICKHSSFFKLLTKWSFKSNLKLQNLKISNLSLLNKQVPQYTSPTNINKNRIFNVHADNDMKIAVQKNHLMDNILYRKQRHCEICFLNLPFF